jgi:putative SbcD/Mre11-related phosphoesterase
MKPEPVPDEAALSIGKSLLVADLHIGLEDEFRQKGYNIPSLTERLEKRLVRLIENRGADRLFILGDLKHSITGSKQDFRDVRDFIDDILEYADIEIIKGNHDGGIQHWAASTEGVVVHGPRGIVLEGHGLFHGHAHPSEKVRKARTLIMAHEHPVVRFTDRLGVPVQMKAWLRADFRDAKKNPRDLIILPAFNDFLGGTTVNSADTNFLSPTVKDDKLNLDDAKIYLLDGAFLGKRKDLI